ncbi:MULTISPECIES: PilZ domain-containing protein [unclassified Synechocystis]|uniref:PilZ domain-containing protein n=1 Tax=unclassified Synechocystis TaxID=2640012 RepID=UPI00041C6A92|nr:MULTISPECIES: PilZ domain-containing protein [unclassified Synechocystis]AIE73169.1 hypothetical protein D082_06400 [Synechocystis sp. PCC 6714]MCT0254315.1 PilZ domain-containing protein [Synechocystis sp. CS-94]
MAAEFPSPDSEEVLTIAHLQGIQERRQEQRMLAFCQVFNMAGELVGVSFDLTRQGICVSVPNDWPQGSDFEVKLRRMDNEALPTITVKVNPMWRQSRNESFDEIGGKIIAVDSPEAFATFLQYCQQAGPSGLVERPNS